MSLVEYARFESEGIFLRRRLRTVFGVAPEISNRSLDLKSVPARSGGGARTSLTTRLTSDRPYRDLCAFAL